MLNYPIFIELSNNLLNDEVSFLNENNILKYYFYDLLLNIKNNNETKIIMGYFNGFLYAMIVYVLTIIVNILFIFNSI